MPEMPFWQCYGWKLSIFIKGCLNRLESYIFDRFIKAYVTLKYACGAQNIVIWSVDKYISNLFLLVHCTTTCPVFTVLYMTNIWTDRNPVHTFYVTWGQNATLQWFIYIIYTAPTIKFLELRVWSLNFSQPYLLPWNATIGYPKGISPDLKY